jgi:hypothetical protein
VLRGEEKRDVHGDAREDRLLDRGQALLRPGDLDEEVVAPGLLVQRLRGFDGALRVVGEERRDLERDPAVDAVRPLVDGANVSAARRRSSIASSKKSGSRSSLLRTSRELPVALAIALSKIAGFDVGR